MKSNLELIKARAMKLKEARAKATPGEWSDLGESCEIHAVDFIDAGGDPLHVCPMVRGDDNTQFICLAANEAEYLADTVIKLAEALAEIIKDDSEGVGTTQEYAGSFAMTAEKALADAAKDLS